MPQAPSRQVTDQMGRAVTVPVRPQRIISLVPSQTELLFYLGAADAVVGRTRFCIHPAAQVKETPIIGGTKTLRFDSIDALQPDLIIGNKEENDEAAIHRLVAAYPVWMSDIHTLAHALAMIRQVGHLTGTTPAATQLAQQIQHQFEHLAGWSQSPRVAYFIWQKPYMVAGRHTFIHDMLTRCGLVNAFADVAHGRYPQVTPEMIQAAHLDYIFLASEPFPFQPKHQHAFAAQFPDVTIRLVDGEMFSWYGSRLLTAVAYFETLKTL